MSTGVIIALIVIVAAVVVVAAVLTLRARAGAGGGGSLRRRFGPEYDRTVTRHDGDERAAARELTERVKRYGSLEKRPLRSAERERYEARWAAAQERFVDSPREAVAEADRLLAELAGARGFPDEGRYETQLEALSVHHGHHVQGYRRVHLAARGSADGADGAHGRDGVGTEEMRAAMVEARALFDDLVTPGRLDARADRDRDRTADEDRRVPAARSHGRSPMPWAFTRRHAKGS
ncbi:hypothetical protein PV416_27735 [Streptomyces ipomoeae]|jgi:hypothetical protein|uniref:hypothetical protein n=1 Tax=Streptomyces ipomoeae TaxID=103232 RepID=UPI0029BD4969|nr:hypothetical protein [Streptomyces ipomoeae]MDX2824785.1 hypothetical protein [Streptomyces ipomoeae]MDX2875243.1 hypothetical protein [Streptomyces ipomoeae]